MTSTLSLILSALFVAAAGWAFGSKDARTTRRLGIAVSFVALVASAVPIAYLKWSAGADLGSLLPPGYLRFAPMVTSAVAVLAVGLASVAVHGAKTMARILLVLALSFGFFATSNAMIAGCLWALSAAVVWWELRSRGHALATSRLFLIYHGLSAALFLGGAVVLGLGHLKAGSMLMLGGIGIRQTVIPVHTWFTRFVESSPMGMVVAFAGPQLGIYGHLQFIDAGVLDEFAALIAAFAAVTAIGAALLGTAQRHARRALAYLIMSQTGLIGLGLAGHSEIGIVGAVLNWQVLALSTSGFAMVLAAFEARTGRLVLNEPNGCFAKTPRLAVAFLFLGFASVGFPLTLGFVAEDLLVQGSVDKFPLLGMSLILATAFNGITVMRAFFVLFTGKRGHGAGVDLTLREVVVVSGAMVVLLVSGLYPGPVIDGQKASHHDTAGEQSATLAESSTP